MDIVYKYYFSAKRSILWPSLGFKLVMWKSANFESPL